MLEMLVSLSLAAAATLNFAPAPGWHVATRDAHTPCGAFAVATTVTNELPRMGQCASTGLRDEGSFRGDNVRITAMVIGRYRWRKFPVRRLPLRLGATRIHRCFEGIPCEFAYQDVLARVKGWDLEVFVVYGRAKPPRALKRRASAEVVRLRLA
jgi:hypothetical protein